MKKVSLVFKGFFFLLLSSNVHAQSKSGADYFAGKWNVLIKGTPGGDARMFVALERTDSAMTGAVQDSTGIEISKISKVELTDSSVKVYFTAQSYDVNLLMEKKGDDHVTGNMLNMFDAEGDRVKN
jgi:hypothetical protein